MLQADPMGTHSWSHASMGGEDLHPDSPKEGIGAYSDNHLYIVLGKVKNSSTKAGTGLHRAVNYLFFFCL
jgi:hypothetical protein